MKIRKIQIAAFGKLSGFTLDMRDGFHVLYGVNEAGKSTLMYFIRVMFYGFNKNARRDNLAENDRERFKPWHSTLYGGSILFEHEGSLYSLERTFGATKAKDTTKLTNDVTGNERRLSLPDEPGSELFGLGKTEFLNTVFVRQLGSVVDEDENIKAKLVALAAGSGMEISADSMMAALMEKRRKIYSDRKNSQSEMSLLEEKLNALQEERAEAIRKELERKNLADEIEADQILMSGKRAEIRLAEVRLEASRRIEETKNIDEILALDLEADKYRKQAEDLQKPDSEGRLMPHSEDILAVREVTAKMLAIRGNITMLQGQEEAAAAEKEALPDEEEIIRRLGAIQSAEEEFTRLEEERSAIKEASDTALRAFEEEDRELERELSQVTVDAEKMKTAFGEKYAGLQTALGTAKLRKNEIQSTLERQKADRERALSEERYRLGEDTKRLAETKNQLETAQNAIPDLEARQKWLEGRLSAEVQAAHSSGIVVRKKALPILIAVGILLMITGAAGFLAKSPIWPGFALGVGAGIVAITLLLAFFARNTRPADTGIEVSAQREGWNLELQSVGRQKNNELQKIHNLELDAEEYERRIQQYKIDIDQYNAGAGQSAAERKASSDVEEADRIIARTEQEMSSLKAEYEAEMARQNLVLSEIAGRKAKHTYTPSEELTRRQALYEGAVAAWTQSLPQTGADSRDQLGKVKDELLAQRTAHSEKDNQIKTYLAGIETATRDNEDLLDRLKQIAEGQFFSADMNEIKEKTDRAEAGLAALNTLLTDIRHIEDKRNALSGGKSTEELTARKAGNRIWLDRNAPDASALDKEEEALINRGIDDARAGLQNMSQELGRKNSELSRIERESRLPDEIEADIKEAKEQTDLCRSRLRSLDLAASMIRETDEEMRKTFGPIINSKTAEYLAGLTGQTEEKLRVTGNFDVQIADRATMSYKEHTFFSGGKIDQIYLALRLAVTDTVYTGKGKEGLPLFLDDILVQYDVDRGRRAVDFLVGMNREQNRQIFFFTCHEQIKKYCIAQGCLVTDL